MARGWQAVGAGHAATAAGLAAAAKADGAKLAFRAEPLTLDGLGPLDFLGAEGPQQAPVALEKLYPQNPALVAAFAPLPAGLRLTAFLHAEDRGFGMDLRLTGVDELRRVSLPLRLGWSADRHDASAALAGLGRPGLGKGVSVSLLGKAALLLDVGELGAADFRKDGVDCTLFDSYLEKGVILVARWALRPYTDAAALQKDLAEWLDAPPAL